MRIDINTKCNKEFKSYSELFIYIPKEEQIIRIAEGTGDNLDNEDIANGFVDYIYYDQYELDNGVEEYDGGMILLTEMFRDKYTCVLDCVGDVLDFIFGNKDLDYVVLK